MPTARFPIALAFSAAALALAAPQAFSAQSGGVLTGAAAFGDWRSDAPGVVRKISPGDLPPPFAGELAAFRSQVAPRPEGAWPRTPEGFSAEIFASGLKGPRTIRVAPNGDVFVVESNGGQISVFPGGQPGPGRVFVSGLERPSGLAFYPPGPEPRWIYVSTPSQLLRYAYRPGQTQALGEGEKIADLPGDGGHWTRDLVFSPDAGTLYVAVGSKTNVAEGHPQPTAEETSVLEKNSGRGASAGSELLRADVLAFDPEGGHKRVFATGLRNCSGLTIRPGTSDVWCVVNERDMLGDDLPPDYATKVKPAAFYGWPWYYIGAHEDPRHAGRRPDLSAEIATPDILFQPHSAPLGLAFYEGAQFPESYKGDAFVALHGSWNRSKRTGYKVVRLRFRDGAPTGEYEDFLTGFVVAADDSRVWGRPVDPAVAADGSLLVTDDAGGAIWRIAYKGK
ncbi:sorbosone dehydrogenase family protein [Methylocystis heyeri]|uniref:Sorbosone dehydrogenase family protein n=2 Tax=Methylocystis heyeri TaxID=391905 RepID=A0A6B8KDV6_9HYPH|nr:sorbosone dehydrogenase family protein [Methylocystis heyeri]